MTVPYDASAADDDAHLLAAFARGDRGAARSLTDRHLPRAYRFALRVLGDRADAEDVAQETMLRLWQQAAHWRPGEARVSTWVYRVTANLCTDRLRRRRTRGTVDLDAAGDPPDGAPGPEARLHSAARTAALEAALATLPDRQRQAVVLRHIEGLGNPEIAEVLGIGVEAVESLTARGKRALAAALAGRREDLGHEP
jgi:RNA polymerase sigma-70 factor (ECF subfamily)